MKSKAFYLLLLLINGSFRANAQLNVAVKNGIIYIENGGVGRPDPRKYGGVIDSLEKNIKTHPNDTTSLFERALLFEQLNNQLAKPSTYSKDPIEFLTIAKNIVEHAVTLQMKDIRLKILHAQIFRDLVYQFSVSESWKFTSKQISDRQEKYLRYKAAANSCYEELSVLDKRNAYDYLRLKVK